MGIRITEDRVVHDTDLTLEICAKDIRASEIGPRIGGRKTVLIHADILRLDSPLVAPSAAVTLIARKAYGGAQASVDVSGVDGVDALQTAYPPPVDAGTIAKNGDDGGAGGRAGSISVLFKELEGSLSLVAKGGLGGKAQPGSNGANGRHGYPDDVQKKPGGPGGDAGAPGRAGTPGSSGNGGSILHFVDKGGDQISANIDGGVRQVSSAHGTPGTPGKGGRGGAREFCYPEPHLAGTGNELVSPFLRKECYFDGTMPPGLDGNPAAPISDPVPVGQPGSQGFVVSGSVFAHSLPIPLRGLKLLSVDADVHHLLGNEEEAASKAAWLFAISGGELNGQAKEVRMRLAATLGRIASGMPPVGLQGIYCSLRPIEFHMDSLKRMMESRFRFKFYLSELRAENLQAETVARAAKDVIDHAVMVQSLAKARKEEVDRRLKDVEKQLDAIKATYWDVWLDVQKADGTFKDAVAKKNPCGSFLNAVIAVSMVVSTVASGGASAASFVAGGAEAFQWLNKDKETKKKYDAIIDSSTAVKTRLEGLAKDSKGVADAATKFKEFLGGDDLQPPSDEVRISMSREDFNRMIEPYKGMAQAENLRKRMDKFFSLTESRNSLLVENTQLIYELASIQAAVATAQRHREDFESAEGSVLLTMAGDVYEAALWADLDFGKSHLAALSEANSAFEYEWIAPRFVDLSSTRAENVEKEYNRMLDDRRRIPVDNRLQAMSEFQIDKESHEEVFKQLATDRAFVSLMPEHAVPARRSRWDERSVSVGIRLEFGSGPMVGKVVQIPAMVTSLGVSWFRSETGQMYAMKVPKRSAPCVASNKLDLEVVFEERNFMDVKTEIVEVSPYGVWSVHLPGIAGYLPHITKLHFVFVGSARHSPEARVAISRFGDTLLEMRVQEALKQTDPPTTGIFSLAPVQVLAEPAPAFPGAKGARLREALKMQLVEDAIYSSTTSVTKPVTA